MRSHCGYRTSSLLILVTVSHQRIRTLRESGVYTRSQLPAGVGHPLDSARVSLWITDFQGTGRESQAGDEDSPFRPAFSEKE